MPLRPSPFQRPSSRLRSHARLIRSALFIGVAGPFFAMTEPTAPSLPSQDSLRLKAQASLERALQEESGFIRIHAAEALLATGSAERVRTAFHAASTSDLSRDPTRIGIWRVLALLSANASGSNPWISEVRRVAIDPAARDRLQAVETLGKLGVRLPSSEGDAIRAYAVAASPAVASFPWWVLHLNGAPDALPKIVAALSAPDPLARLRAAYVLKRDNLTGAGAGEALARAWATEPADSVAYPFLLCAMATLAEDAAQRRDCADRLGRFATDPRPTGGRYEACLTLMRLWPAESADKFAGLLDSSDADTRIGAAWAILHLTRAKAAR